MVIVSHDREFLDGLVDKVYEFRNQGTKEYLGGIFDFLQKRKIASINEIERKEKKEKKPAGAKPKPKPKPGGESKKAPTLDYKQKKEQEKRTRKISYDKERDIRLKDEILEGLLDEKDKPIRRRIR